MAPIRLRVWLLGFSVKGLGCRLRVRIQGCACRVSAVGVLKEEIGCSC